MFLVTVDEQISLVLQSKSVRIQPMRRYFVDSSKFTSAVAPPQVHFFVEHTCSLIEIVSFDHAKIVQKLKPYTNIPCQISINPL